MLSNEERLKVLSTTPDHLKESLEHVKRGAWHRMRMVNYLISKFLTFSSDKISKMKAALYTEEQPSAPGSTTLISLPITHLTIKEPSNVDMLYAAGRRIGESVEKAALGLIEPVYGLCNHPSRITYKLSAKRDYLGLFYEIKKATLQLRKNGLPGPYAVFCGPEWDYVLDDDWQLSVDKVPEETVRQHCISSITGLVEVMTLELLEGRQFVAVQLTPDVVRIIIGSKMVLTEAGEEGVRAACCMVPQLRVKANGVLGVCHIQE